MVFGVDAVLTIVSCVSMGSGKVRENLVRGNSLHARDFLAVGNTQVGKIQDLFIDD